MEKTEQKTETKRIIIYLGITFALTYGYCFGVVYPFMNDPVLSITAAGYSQLLIAAVMFCPAVGVLFTRLITKEGFKNAWIRPHFKGNIKVYLLAYFGPGILTILGAGIYFLIFPKHFDADCGYLQLMLGTSGAENGISLSVILAIQTLEAFILGPILNFITCFGEEWGWRGYLLSKMSKKLPAVPMLLVNGVIWGLWHAPLTAIGHNYGVGYPGFPFTGIAAMCGFCIVLGVFLSYISLKTKSCIPAVLAHGAINSIASIGIYFTTDGGNPFVGPAPTGIIGALPFIAVAVLMCVFYFAKKERNKE